MRGGSYADRAAALRSAGPAELLIGNLAETATLSGAELLAEAEALLPAEYLAGS